MNPITSATGTGNDPASTTASNPKTETVDKNTFLKLLVAQLQHQDPLQPQDGTQFLAQLAQFQQLETSLNSSQDIAGIRSDLDLLVQAQTPSGETSHV